MSEGSQRARVVKLLKPLHAIPVENPMVPGTPDVNFAGGWIELKWARAWPKGAEVPLALPHFTMQQRRWLIKRTKAGEACWLLLQVRREWLLFDGATAAEVVGLAPRLGLVERSRHHWANGINKELISCVQR